MEYNKQLSILAIISIVALSALSAATLCQLRQSAPVVFDSKATLTNIISVSGTGAAYGNPDIAYVGMAVVTQAATASEAQERNANIMKGVIESIKRIGVNEGDMRTDQYSLRPIYSYDKEQSIVSYECRNSLRITWRRIGDVGLVLDTAVKAGANSLGTVTFSLSQQKMELLKTDAIKNAVSDADSRAQALASALGVRITGKVSASIGSPYVSTQLIELRASQTPIIPGDLEVSVTVSVNYAFA